MKYLNLGCGTHYSTDKKWTNVDFVAYGKDVIQCNLLRGIPFSDCSYDLVYHSHVLEHFSKSDGYVFLKECFRVLKPGGILRIAIPDLEGIVRNYLAALEKGLNDELDVKNAANYDWMLIEMYDQTVRNHSGGEMVKYLSQPEIVNEPFVMGRIGHEGALLRNGLLKAKEQPRSSTRGLLSNIKRRLLNILPGNSKDYYQIGAFRSHGEIHQWMYDRYSLKRILGDIGFEAFQIHTAFTSSIPEWVSYGLDSIGANVRKPDSLFVEVRKKAGV